MNRINENHDRKQQQTQMNMPMNPYILHMAGNFLTSQMTVSFPKTTLIHRIKLTVPVHL